MYRQKHGANNVFSPLCFIVGPVVNRRPIINRPSSPIRSIRVYSESEASDIDPPACHRHKIDPERTLHPLRQGCSPLFGCFVGTTCSSDSPPSRMLAVSLSAFSSRSGALLPDANGVSRFSRSEFPDVPGVSDCAGSACVSPLSSPAALPSDSQKHRRLSQLDTLPRLCRCQRFACRFTTTSA